MGPIDYSNNTQPAGLQPKSKMDPRVRNTIIYCVVTGSIIVFGIIGIVLLLTFGRARKTNLPIVEKMPTLDLAQSVCEEYGGEFSFDNGVSDGRCSRYDDELKFYFAIQFNKDEDREKMWAYTDVDSYNYKILEKSDDYFKAYTNSSDYYTVLILYKNVMATIMVSGADFIDELVAKLGFPNDNSVSESISAGDEADYKPIADNITPEATEMLCDKYGGKIMEEKDTRFGAPLVMTTEFPDSRICERYTYREVDPEDYRDSSSHIDGTPLSDQEIQEMYGITIGPKDFSYGVGFLKENERNEYWNAQRDKYINFEAHEDISKYTILEDSDEMFKACNSVAGMMLTCFGMHDNIVVGIMSGGDFSTMDKLFANLGFPNRAKLEEYVNSKKAESNK